MITSGTPSVFDSDSYTSEFGSVEAQFTAENICGSGATCIVYQMRVDGLRVAVKRLLPEHYLNPTYVAAYRKEYEIGRRLKHDALPVYRDLRNDKDEVYIVMDFVDGVTLDKFLKTREGSAYFEDAENCRRFLTQLLDAVTYLHRSGVIHCDLKPANIMLRHSDRAVMIVDLDKAYCDTLDLTHGGTPGISDTIPYGEKPAASKDFMAIGRILDVLNDNVRNFPKSGFKRFRRECFNRNVTTKRLYDCLRPVSHRWLWIAIAFVLIISGALIIYKSDTLSKLPVEDTDKLENSSQNGNSEQVENAPENGNQQIAEEEEITGTSHNKEQKPQGNVSGPQDKYSESMLRMPSEEESKKYVPQYLLDIECDIDEEMKDVIQEMEKALVILKTDQSDDQKREISSAVSKSFITSYNKILDKCERKYPEIDKEEIRDEMTRRMDYSNAAKLHQKVKTACRER